MNNFSAAAQYVFTTFQRDVSFLLAVPQQPRYGNDKKAQDLKVTLAASRAITAFLLGLTVLSSLSAVHAFVMTGSAVKIALTIVSFVAAYDLFTIFDNISIYHNSPGRQLYAGLLEVFSNHDVIEEFTKNTFLKPFYRPLLESRIRRV
ncbi:MAG: hypothetical protein H0W88_08290 [Parachlamydiaceae bacterium]|nr:hypothetical protein [Parachlamydiaceae bacterium]